MCQRILSIHERTSFSVYCKRGGLTILKLDDKNRYDPDSLAPGEGFVRFWDGHEEPIENWYKVSNEIIFYTPSGHYRARRIAMNDKIREIDTDDLPMYIRKITDTWEVSMEVTASACEAFIQLATVMRDSLLDCCPNKRVVHLAKHAKKKRTRKKNLHRAIKNLNLEDILNAET